VACWRSNSVPFTACSARAELRCDAGGGDTICNATECHAASERAEQQARHRCPWWVGRDNGTSGRIQRPGERNNGAGAWCVPKTWRWRGGACTHALACTQSAATVKHLLLTLPAHTQRRRLEASHAKWESQRASSVAQVCHTRPAECALRRLPLGFLSHSLCPASPSPPACRSRHCLLCH
jgi:hypothetical protein